MTTHLPTVKVAVVQAAPVLFDREATVAKTCRLAAEAAAQGAKLILFPEAFIPAYPRGLTFGTVIGSRSAEGRRTWERYWANSVVVPGPATEALGAAARQAGAYLAVGVIERDGEFSGGTLYCTTALFRPGRQPAGQAPQAQADRGRAPGVGRGRRQHADGHRDRVRQAGRADLLGELHAAGAHGAVRQGGRALPGAHRRQPRHLAGHAAPHRVRGPLLRARLQPVRDQGDVPGRPAGDRGSGRPAGGHVPRGQRHRVAAGRRDRGAAVRRGGHPLRRAGPGRRRAREVRFRRGRPLRAAGRVPVDGQRTADGSGEIELVTLSGLRRNRQRNPSRTSGRVSRHDTETLTRDALWSVTHFEW